MVVNSALDNVKIWNKQEEKITEKYPQLKSKAFLCPVLTERIL